MKNKTNNPFGRPKGVPNKTTSEMRAVFSDLLNANLETIQSDLDKLEPKDRLTILLKMSEYVIPRLQSTQMESVVEIKSKSFILWGDQRIPI
jgi:hypothetical protein